METKNTKSPAFPSGMIEKETKIILDNITNNIYFKAGYRQGQSDKEKEMLDVFEKICKEKCYCKDGDGTFYSETKEGEEFCAFCWLLKERLQKLRGEK